MNDVLRSAGLSGQTPRPIGQVSGGTAPGYAWLAILLALALLPTLALAAPSPSPAETNLAWQGPTVRIDPAESVANIGKTFTISVMIEEAEDLGGFEFTLLFVTTTVQVDGVTLGGFLGSTGRTVIPVGPTIDNQAGTASIGAATVGSAIPGASGIGALATITFTAQGAGISLLDLQNVMVVDTTAERQTPTVEDGLAQVRFAVYLPLILIVRSFRKHYGGIELA